MSMDAQGRIEVGGNRTVTDKRPGNGVHIEAVYTVENGDQQRTRIKKQLFLEYLQKTRGVVYLTCEKVGIGRQTYYDWLKADAVFAAAVQEVEADKNNVAADILWSKVSVERDGPSVRYYLDRKHPGYKPKIKVEEQVVGDKTLEDLLDDEEDHGKTNEHGTDRGIAEDPKQTAEAGAVQTEPGTASVHGEADATQPHTQS